MEQKDLIDVNLQLLVSGCFVSSFTVSVGWALISNNSPGVLLLWIHSLPKAMGE